MWVAEMALTGGLVGGVVMLALIVWPPGAARLPDPSSVGGMPMAGPASQKAADAAINRKKRRRRN